MGSVSSGFQEFVLEQLAPMGHLTAQRMFSGAGIKLGGVNFAILLDNTLYLRSDDDLRAKLEAAGGAPFEYDTKVRHVVVKSYVSVPADVLEDRDAIVELGKEALAEARRVKAAEKKKPARPAKPKAKRRTSS
jgi:DNA transformation protein